MAKPILLIRVPNSAKPEQLESIGKHLSNKLNDYHVLIINADVDDILLETFFEKDLEDIEFNEFKDYVISLIKESV